MMTLITFCSEINNQLARNTKKMPNYIKNKWLKHTLNCRPYLLYGWINKSVIKVYSHLQRFEN